MKQLFTIVMFFLLLDVHSQCANLSSYTSPGIYPSSSLEFCDQANANKDLYIIVDATSIPGVPVQGSIDRVHIDAITNLPIGMSYTLSEPTAEYYRVNNLIKICVNFNGNINDISYGTDSPVISGDLDYTLTGIGPGTLSDQNLPYDFSFTVNSSSSAQCISTAVNNYGTEELTLYPNPISSSGILVLSQAASIEIIDFLGNSIYSGDAESSVDLGNLGLTSGVYFVKAKSSQGQFTKKIVVK